MQSRIFDSIAVPSAWKFSSVPVGWGVEPYRNIVAGLIATVVSLPLTMGLGVLTLAPFGPEYTVLGMMAGFQNAAAITIMISQLHILLGWTQAPAMHDWLAVIAETRFLQLILGFVTLALIFNGHRIIKSVPPILTALPAMVIAAASIAVVASLDVLISAKLVENLSGQRGNSTRELLCIGTANAITPLLGGIAGSISLGATTTNFRSGARNSLSLFTHGVMFLLVISFLAPLVGVIPKVVIAAIVIFAGSQLFDRWTFNFIKKIIKRQVIKWPNISVDFVVILLVTAVALTGQIVVAVGFGIIISVIVFTVRMSQAMRSISF